MIPYRNTPLIQSILNNKKLSTIEKAKRIRKHEFEQKYRWSKNHRVSNQTPIKELVKSVQEYEAKNDIK